MSQDCFGTHRYHVADVAVVEDEGTVNVISICLQCGDSKIASHKVTGKNIRLIKGKANESV